MIRTSLLINRDREDDARDEDSNLAKRKKQARKYNSKEYFDILNRLTASADERDDVCGDEDPAWLHDLDIEDLVDSVWDNNDVVPEYDQYDVEDGIDSYIPHKGKTLTESDVVNHYQKNDRTREVVFDIFNKWSDQQIEKEKSGNDGRDLPPMDMDPKDSPYACHVERSRDGMVFHDGENHYDHVILVFADDVIEFIENSFVCCYCKNRLKREKFNIMQKGVATDITYTCGTCNKQPRFYRLASRTTENAAYLAGNRMANLSTYELNKRWVLAMQRIGGGGCEANEIAGQLGMSHCAFYRWVDLEESVAQIELEVAREIFAENLRMEVEASEMDLEVNRKKLKIATDGGWLKRCLSYNSPVGHVLAVGLATGKPIALQCKSRLCNLCVRGVEHAKELCLNNHEGSSGSMEPLGVAEIVNNIYGRGDAYVCQITMDDDASSRKIVKPSSGRKNAIGRLPRNHPKITWKTDPGHRLRTIANSVFKLSKQRLSLSKVHRVDAIRLKRNTNYAVKQNLHEDFPTFKKRLLNVVEHHFGNHSECGPWCPAVAYKDDPEKLATLVYREKESEEGLKMYNQVIKARSKYMTDSKIREMHHTTNTQKCESLMAIITKYCPKGKYLWQTIATMARTHVAVAANSEGLLKFYTKLYERLGMAMSITTSAYLGKKDHQRRRDTHRKYTKDYRLQRTRLKVKRMREQLRKELKSAKEMLEYKKNIALKDEENADESKEKETDEMEVEECDEDCDSDDEGMPPVIEDDPMEFDFCLETTCQVRGACFCCEADYMEGDYM